MSQNRYRIPSTSALQAFESAARHCNFSRAAEELHTSLDPRIDVVIGYDVSGVDASDRVRLVGEAVRPVASPQQGFSAAFPGRAGSQAGIKKARH